MPFWGRGSSVEPGREEARSRDGESEDPGDEEGGRRGGARGRSRSQSRSHSRSREQEFTRRRRAAPPSKQGQRWWSHNQRWRRDGDDRSFVGEVRNLWVPVSERGRILGDRGSNVKRIVEGISAKLEYDVGSHGRPPFVNFSERDGWLHFELELYPPFNNEGSFEVAEKAFCDALEEMMAAPVAPESRHCLRPKRIQPDDWECPNRKCGNLCFARRKVCPLCGAEKPSYRDRAAPSTSSNLPDWLFDGQVSRPPKHKMEMIRTVDRLPPLCPGECQVIWLVPYAKRGAVIGRGGDSVVSIKEQSGSEVLVTDVPETRLVDGQPHCVAILRGLPESVRTAMGLVRDYAGGGRLAQDGLEPLLAAAEDVLASAAGGGGQARRYEESWVPLSEVASGPAVKEEMSAARDVMRGAGLRTLLEVLELWPDHFWLRRTGPRGAEVFLREALPQEWRLAAAEARESGGGAAGQRE